MSFYNIVAQSSESTVVTEYKPASTRSDAYQSEADLEREFIRLLQEQSYEYLKIHHEQDLIKNLRKKLEELNNYVFSDEEWERFFTECIANKNEGIVEKTRKIQEDNVQRNTHRYISRSLPLLKSSDTVADKCAGTCRNGGKYRNGKY